VRTLHTGLDRAAILAVRRELADALYYRVPVGLSTSWPPAPSARVTATDRAGLARLVARLEPLVCIKG
jgi:RNA-splicing ligase RtcB